MPIPPCELAAPFAMWTAFPGRPGALLRPAPLRTGLAGFLASGSSKPCGLAGGQKCWAAAVVGGVPMLAVGVYETALV